MTSRDHLLEPLTTAVSCLCGEGPFIKRLENATVSALVHLEDTDLQDTSTARLSEDLKFVLNLTKENMVNGVFLREPTEAERAQLIEKILGLLNWCSSHG